MKEIHFNLSFIYNLPTKHNKIRINCRSFIELIFNGRINEKYFNNFRKHYKIIELAHSQNLIPK